MFGWLRRRKQLSIDPSEIDLGFPDTEPEAFPAGTSTLAASSAEPLWISDPDMDRIAEIAARRAIDELDAELRISGQQLTADQRQQLLQLRGARITLEMLSRHRDTYLRDEEAAALRESIEQLKVAIVANRTKTMAQQARDIWRRHPFLTGFLGADLVYRVEKLLNER